MFAQGQAYVALSRARSLEGLQILDWDPGCVQTNPAVAAFYMALKVSSGWCAGPTDSLARWGSRRRADGRLLPLDALLFLQQRVHADGSN